MTVALFSCKGKGNGRTSSTSEDKVGESVSEYAGYLPPNPPAIMTGQEQMQLLTDGGLPDPQPVERLMEKCLADKPRMDFFSMLAEKILNDPNSPYREDELYMPVLQARISSGLYDNATQIRDRHALNIAMQNRIGHKANDFKYTLKDGSTGTLYGVKAPYTLVFINNPGCNMCRTVREGICASPYLMQLIDDGTYNLNAIPALYLLDADKTVLIKDGTDVGAIERVIAAN